MLGRNGYSGGKVTIPLQVAIILPSVAGQPCPTPLLQAKAPMGKYFQVFILSIIPLANNLQNRSKCKKSGFSAIYLFQVTGWIIPYSFWRSTFFPSLTIYTDLFSVPKCVMSDAGLGFQFSQALWHVLCFKQVLETLQSSQHFIMYPEVSGHLRVLLDQSLGVGSRQLQI